MTAMTHREITARRHARVAPIVLGLVLLGAVDAVGQERAGWVSLFNGKDLEGWTPKIKGYDAGVNEANTFRVEDGVLKVSYDRYPRFDGKFGHLFSNRKYSNYRL